MRALGCVVIVALIATACASSQDVTGERRNVGDVTVTFAVDPSVSQVGTSVEFRIRLGNTSGRTETLTFTSGQHYDFWVTDEGTEVWRWSDGMFFTQDINELEIPSQTGETFTESWTPEATGTYLVHGVLLAEGYGREMTGELSVR